MRTHVRKKRREKEAFKRRARLDRAHRGHIELATQFVVIGCATFVFSFFATYRSSLLGNFFFWGGIASIAAGFLGIVVVRNRQKGRI